MLTHYTPFNADNNGDYATPQESWGYGGYIKKQVLPGFGIQADFLAGKVKGFRPNATPGSNSGFETRIDWSAALKANFTLANLSLNQKRTLLSPLLYSWCGLYVIQCKCETPGTSAHRIVKTGTSQSAQGSKSTCRTPSTWI